MGRDAEHQYSYKFAIFPVPIAITLKLKSFAVTVVFVLVSAQREPYLYVMARSFGMKTYAPGVTLALMCVLTMQHQELT